MVSTTSCSHNSRPSSSDGRRPTAPRMRRCFFAALHDQALARAGVAIILFLDLKQFFPRIPPEGIAFGALLHGLPPVVQQLAARDFAVMEGRYESQSGLGEAFTIDWGALMGCVLSTQKARIMLNSLVEAILRHVRGVNLYGTRDHAAIDLQADDLAAVIHADTLAAAWRDSRRLWSICAAWSVATGAQIGVKAKSKMAYAAFRIHDRGGCRDVESLDAPSPLRRGAPSTGCRGILQTHGDPAAHGRRWRSRRDSSPQPRKSGNGAAFAIRALSPCASARR